MAKLTTSHSKYKSLIVSKTDMRKLKSSIDAKMSDIKLTLIRRLSYIGEEAVKIAREDHENNWTDVTGNLRSSIGYTVLVDGVPVTGLKEQFVRVKGKSGDGSEGIPAAQNLLKTLQAKFPWGVVLIVCAGMNYAAYVESVKHRDVLTSAELRAEQLAKKFLKNLRSDD